MKTLVIGASNNPERYSYKAIVNLLKHNHAVEAIGRKEDYVETIEIKKGFPKNDDIDTVTLYINPNFQEEYYDYIINLKPRRVIFNPGTENPEFYQLLKSNSIEVEVACTLVLLATNQY